MKIKLITFRELLNLIHEGKQPNKVWLSGTNLEWEWESADEEYYWRDVNGGIEFVTDIVTLEEFVIDRYNAKQLAEKKIIGFFDDILTDKERAMKAILILEKHEHCIDCPLLDGEYDTCVVTGGYVQRMIRKEDKREIPCPLKPMPSREDIHEEIYQAYGLGKEERYERMRDAVDKVLDEILGEEECTK